MNILTFMLDDGSHIMTSKYSDYPVQKLFFELDKKHSCNFNKIKINYKNGSFFVGDKKLIRVIVEKQIIHRKEFPCPT